MAGKSEVLSDVTTKSMALSRDETTVLGVGGTAQDSARAWASQVVGKHCARGSSCGFELNFDEHDGEATVCGRCASCPNPGVPSEVVASIIRHAQMGVAALGRLRPAEMRLRDDVVFEFPGSDQTPACRVIPVEVLDALASSKQAASSIPHEIWWMLNAHRWQSGMSPPDPKFVGAAIKSDEIQRATASRKDRFLVLGDGLKQLFIDDELARKVLKRRSSWDAWYLLRDVLAAKGYLELEEPES